MYQDTPLCRGILAEIAADIASRLVVSELYRLRRSLEDFDSDRIYREHYRRVLRFLPRFQKLLVGSPETVSNDPRASVADNLISALSGQT